MKNSVGKKVPPKGAAGVTKANNDVILKSTQNQDKEKSKILDDETEKQKTRIIRPTCQLSLSDHAIQEDITIVLTANDPKVSINTVKYNYKDKVSILFNIIYDQLKIHSINLNY